MSTAVETYRDAALIYRAKHDAAAMAELVAKYEWFFIFLLRRMFPDARRVPLPYYLGSMTMAFMAAVHGWEARGELTTYAAYKMRQAIIKQQRDDRVLPGPHGKPWPEQFPLTEPPTDRRWSGRVLAAPCRDPLPDWCSPEMLAAMFSTFSPRMREIVRLRADDKTLEEVAKTFRVTRERIRQIEMKARRIMQRNLHIYQCRWYARTTRYWQTREPANGL